MPLLYEHYHGDRARSRVPRCKPRCQECGHRIEDWAIRDTQAEHLRTESLVTVDDTVLRGSGYDDLGLDHRVPISFESPC